MEEAYCCGTDGAFLEADASGVHGCPTCGARTDAPRTGLLADGFDVVHRQWGLRGDPHVWRALRDRLADTPTPEGAEPVRSAYVAAFNDIVGVDLDAEQQPHVYREELDHGGMSGGHVDLEWWRTKGLPLLVERTGR